MQFLFAIDNVFCIPGRGCILLPGIPYAHPQNIAVGADLVIERLDGSRLITTLAAYEMLGSRAPMQHAPFSLPRKIAREELPCGARVFLADGAPQCCEVCAAPTVTRLMYGLPTEEAMREVERGTAILGGCDVSPTAAQWHCTTCRHEWGITEWAPFLQMAEERTQLVQAAKDAEAQARGPLQARVSDHGLVRCPHCRRSFDVRSPMSWDGERHRSCGTYLNLSTEPGA